MKRASVSYIMHLDLGFSHDNFCFITAGVFRIVNATDAMMEICYRNHERRNKETRLS
jgi:hypothetical protein